MSFNINTAILKEFEDGLDTRFLAKSKITAKIIGFGEISTVFTINHPLLQGFAFKRLPIFSNDVQIARYERILTEYVELLKYEIGIDVLETEGVKVETSDRRFVYYVVQPMLPEFSICNSILRRVSIDNAVKLLRSVLINLKRIWDFNAKSMDVKVAIDGQLSNWAVRDLKYPEEPLSENPELVYLDITTPLYRKNGKEALNADLFLKSMPPILRSVLKLLFLKEVLDRYYDPRHTVIDLIANLYREKLTYLIPPFIEFANEFLRTYCAELNLKEIEYKEVEYYYKNDAFIWSLFLFLRKLHRGIVTKILHQRYEFILPERIER